MSNNNSLMSKKFFSTSLNLYEKRNEFIINKVSELKSLLNEKELFKFILENHSWPYVQKFKKHICKDHCRYIINYHSYYQKKWEQISGIYKITFLPNRLFTYYGSSKSIGKRIKYHYYNGSNKNNFLGLLINTFGWSSFSITLVEECDKDKLRDREDWYLNRFKPLLNFLTHSYVDASKLRIMSPITRNKISTALKGKIVTLETREKISKSRSGWANYYYGKRLHSSTLLAAKNARGKVVYVYNEKDMHLVNDKPFASIRDTVKYLPISPVTLAKKLDTGVPFKGYFYFSNYK
jgi:group I intron endonuclease